MTDQKSLDELLLPILSRFRMRLRLDISSFESFLFHLYEGELQQTILEKMKLEVHKLAGSAKTMGFEDLGTSAFKVEECISGVIATNREEANRLELAPIFEEFLSLVREAIGFGSDDATAISHPIVADSNAMYRVLVIDDDIFARELVHLALKKESCRIIDAATGTAGIEILKFETPDLIVLDVHLPDMTGFEVLHKIQRLTMEKEIPVVMFTRDEDTDSLATGMARGATEYIRKPIRVDELGNILMDVVKYYKVPEPADSPYRPRGGITFAMKRFGFA